jgi:trimeric autotransporter adhesin
MLVHSSFSGWTSTPVSPAYQDVAVAVPSYGAYFAAGTQVQGRTYCATSNGTTPSSPPPAVSNTFFPLAETENVPVQRLAATSDGAHILGLGSNGATPNLYDLVIAPPTIPSDPRLACTTATGPVTLSSTPLTKGLTIPATSTPNGVIPASNSSIAFITYSVPSSVTAAGTLPYYNPASGTVSYLPLNGTATAPVTGAFSSDNKTFYTTTSGDNALHIININGSTLTDSSTILPNLQNITGTGTVAPNLIAQRVKRTTS